ncbi:MAG: hypothetical protein WKG32_04780 [Gemmatimonadaceae bacterium]
MRKITVVMAFVAVTTFIGCKKTGEGEYEVEKPVVGTQTDTVQTPTLDVGTKKDTVIMTRPTVDLKTPAQRKADSARKRP